MSEQEGKTVSESHSGEEKPSEHVEGAIKIPIVAMEDGEAEESSTVQVDEGQHKT